MKKTGSGTEDVDVVPIAELIREANQRLAASLTLAGRHGKPSLHNLPLYILAGPPGAGKTTAFLSAGLSPQLLAGQVQQEATILPTSLCNLWYASDAVFAEAGGRFFNEGTQDWRALLEHLSRDKQSFVQHLGNANASTKVRGLIWFCDVSALLGMPDPARTAALGRKLREYLLGAGEVLGSNFPVYVVFTKADLLPHFSDFFRRISEADSRRVLGCTLPVSDLPKAGEVYSDACTKRLLEAFNRLYLRLADKRLSLLAREPDKARKPGIYEFPRELKRIRESLVQYLLEAFRPNPLQPGPLLRGFYFTGVQEVPAISGMSRISNIAGPSRASNLDATVLFQSNMLNGDTVGAASDEKPSEKITSRLSFVTDFFHTIVLRDGLGQVSAVRNIRQDRFRRVLYGIGAAVSVLLICCFAVSWWGNRKLLSDVGRGAQISVGSTNAAPSLDELRAMERLRKALVPLLEYARDGAPWHLRWGLYAGGRLQQRAYETYFQAFQHHFLTSTEAEFGSRLGALSTAQKGVSYNAAYDTLKAYRMTASGSCPADPAFLTPVFFQAWQGKRVLDQEATQLAEQQVRFYVSELVRQNPYRIAESPELVDNGRRFLSGFGGVDRLVRGLVEDANRPPREPVRLADIAPNFRQVLTGPSEIPPAFTSDGLAYVHERLRHPDALPVGESCVLGAGQNLTSQDGTKIGVQLQELYDRTYVQAWKMFVSGTAVQPFKSNADAARKLEILADNRSPLLAVLFLTAQHTNVTSPTPSQGKEKAEPRGAFADRLFAITLKGVSKQTTPAPQADDSKQFLRVFQPVREVIRTGNQDRLIDDPNRDYMNALGQMQQAMSRLQNYSEANPDAALQQDAQRAVDAGMQAVRQIAQRFNISGSEGMDTEVRRLLEAPFRESAKFVIIDPSKLDRDKFAGAASAFCGKLHGLERTFPFNPQSDVDATSDQVAAVFAPQTGALFQFEEQLGKALLRQGKQWVQNPAVPEPKLAPELLQNLNHLTAISEALYPDGTGRLRMQYDITPLPGPGAEAISLDIDGRKLTVVNGQPQSGTFQWPGAPGAQAVLVRVKAGANIPFASYDGMWGIFRMLNDADPRAPGSRIVELSKVRRGHGRAESVLDQNDRPIQVRLQLSGATSDWDIFDRNFFQIKCPAGVIR